jgi:GNAT superfamily N-acetyltransferase
VAVAVKIVDAAETRPLRRRVLRPHQTIDELAAEDRVVSELIGFAAYDGGDIVGVGTVHREAAPWEPEGASSWRLRAMATDESHRQRGIGSAVLQAVVRHVGERGGGLLWCTARTSALAFYEGADFEVRGESWEEPVIGPHVAMQRIVPPA